GAEQPEVTIRVSPTAEARGRLLDHRGEILSGGRIQFGIKVPDSDKLNASYRICFGGVVASGADGCYVLKDLALGEEYQVNFEHDREKGPWSRLATVRPARAEVIELGDTRLSMPPQPLSLEEKTSRFFKSSG